LVVMGQTGAMGADQPDHPTDAWIRHSRRCLREVFSIRANFVQELKYKRDHPAAEVFHGVVEIRRGGRYRMTYNTPDKRLVVCDGHTIWSYDQPTRTVYTSAVANTILDEAWGLLAGDNAETAFVARYLGGTSDPKEGRAAIELLPRKKDALVASVVVTLSSQCPAVQRILVVDHTGSVMRISLDGIETNVGLGRRRFTFKPPRGTQVIPL
jgi:outer membrane lipoprotein carrier protein